MLKLTNHRLQRAFGLPHTLEVALLLFSAGMFSEACTFYTGPPPPSTNTNPSAGAGNSPNNSNGGNGNGTSGSGDGLGGGVGDAGSGNSEPDPTGVWVNITGKLTKLAAGGGDLSLVTADPHSSRVIVGVAKRGLWTTDDLGKTWVQLGTGAGDQIIDNSCLALTFDPDHPKVFWESGIYGAGAFRTDDDGDTFSLLGNLQHSDLLSVDFTDPKRQTIVAGGHEQPNLLWLSKDGGDNWDNIGATLPPNSRFSTLPLVIDGDTFLLGSCGNWTGDCGVFRSTNGGDSWKVVSSEGPTARPLWASDGTIYWALYSGGMISSADLGKTWKKAAPGPVTPYSNNAPVELPDGRILMLGQEFPLVTADRGMTWKKVAGPLPFHTENCGTYGITYSERAQALFVNHNDCSQQLTTDAVWSVPFDYTAE